MLDIQWFPIAGSVIAILLLHKVFYFYYWIDQKYTLIVQQKRNIRDELMEAFQQQHPKPPTALVKAVLACKASEIVKGITVDGRFTASQIMLVYCHEAIRVHRQTNCLTEILFDQAMEAASKLDEEFAKTKTPRGRLHGLPVSLKDTISIRGFDSTVGLIKRAFMPKKEYAPIVEVLQAAGAIPFVKTNVPQTMMTFECRNPLWGQTDNPFKPGFSPGGSSGGEGALLALKGSPLGIGSDVGGSLRIPAHFSGVCALKPCIDRVPFSGSQGYKPSSLTIHPVNGPMSRCVDDLILMSTVLLGRDSHVDDFRTIPMPFNPGKYEAIMTRKLRFGLMRSDGFAAASPPCVRALDEAAAALRKAGHEVVDFAFPGDIVEAVGLYYALISADGGYHYLKSLEGEPIDPTLKPFFLKLHVPQWVQRLAALTLRRMTRDRRLHVIFSKLSGEETYELYKTLGQRNELCQDFDRAWKQAGIDAMLCPVNAMPAIPYNSFVDLNFAASYTLIWNVLDYSAGVLPVTRVDPAKDSDWPEQRASLPSIFSPAFLDSKLHQYYNAKEMAGLPVGVQVVGPPYSEEVVLAVMKIVEDAIPEYN